MGRTRESLNFFKTQGKCVCGWVPKSQHSFDCHKGKCDDYSRVKRSQESDPNYSEPVKLKRGRKRRRPGKQTPRTNPNGERRGPTPLDLYRLDNTRMKKREAGSTFRKSEEIQQRYEQVAKRLQGELKKMEHWELEMARFKQPRPLEVKLDKKKWEYDCPKALLPSAPFDSDLTKFGQSVGQQRSRFKEYRERFVLKYGLLTNQPTIMGKPVDLFVLYCHVVSWGGLGQVLLKEEMLGQIGKEMGLYGTVTTVGYMLRLIYFKYLFQFEFEYNIKDGKVHRTLWGVDVAGSAATTSNAEFEKHHAAKRRQEPPLTRDPFDPWMHSIAPIRKRAKLGFALHLQSDQKGDVTWALNRLMYMSYRTDVVFTLEHDEEGLLPALTRLVPHPVKKAPFRILGGTEFDARLVKAVFRILANLSLTSQNHAAMLAPRIKLLRWLVNQGTVLGPTEPELLEDILRTLAALAPKVRLGSAGAIAPTAVRFERFLKTAVLRQDHPALVQNAYRVVTGLCAFKENWMKIDPLLSPALLDAIAGSLRSDNPETLLRALEVVAHMGDASRRACEYLLRDTSCLKDLISICSKPDDLPKESSLQIIRTAAYCIKVLGKTLLMPSPRDIECIGEVEASSSKIKQILKSWNRKKRPNAWQAYATKMWISSCKPLEGEQIENKYRYEVLRYTQSLLPRLD